MTGLTPSEFQEHIVIAQWLRAKPNILWCHPGNGELRDKRTAAKLKVMGVSPGVPDFLIFSIPGALVSKFVVRGVALELKRVGKGRVSPAQAGWLEALSDAGWVCRVCYGASDALQWLMSLGY